MTKINPNIGRPSVLDQVSQKSQIQKPDLSKVQADKPGASEFSEFLSQSNAPELRFSNHALKRLESRGIELSSSDMMKLQEAVKKAQDKGAKESLILSDKGAFVVSVKNGTVITAVDKGSMKENIFTNIDSTIMI